MEDILDSVVLQEMICAQCGVHFGISKSLYNLRYKDFGWFWCPNGDQLRYTPPPKERDEELEELRSELEESKDDLATERALREQVEAARRPLFRKKKFSIK